MQSQQYRSILQGPLAGQFASILFAVGLVNAAMLSAAILPLATTYNVNRRDLMGRHTNSTLANAIAISTSAVMVVLTVAMVWTTVRGN